MLAVMSPPASVKANPLGAESWGSGTKLGIFHDVQPLGHVTHGVYRRLHRLYEEIRVYAQLRWPGQPQMHLVGKATGQQRRALGATVAAVVSTM